MKNIKGDQAIELFGELIKYCFRKINLIKFFNKNNIIIYIKPLLKLKGRIKYGKK
jgi:hypothetical protein